MASAAHGSGTLTLAEQGHKLFSEATAYKEKHGVRWSEACRQIKRKYGEPAVAAMEAASKERCRPTLPA